MVHAEIRPVRTEFLCRYGEVDGLQQHIGRGASLRVRRGRPMPERMEAVFLHEIAFNEPHLRSNSADDMIQMRAVEAESIDSFHGHLRPVLHWPRFVVLAPSSACRGRCNWWSDYSAPEGFSLDARIVNLLSDAGTVNCRPSSNIIEVLVVILSR